MNILYGNFSTFFESNFMPTFEVSHLRKPGATASQFLGYNRYCSIWEYTIRKTWLLVAILCSSNLKFQLMGLVAEIFSKLNLPTVLQLVHNVNKFFKATNIFFRIK